MVSKRNAIRNGIKGTIDVLETGLRPLLWLSVQKQCRSRHRSDGENSDGMMG
jgi:hypothetical protein